MGATPQPEHPVSHLPRHLIAVSLLSLQVSACTTWQHPKTSLSPADYVAAERPDRVLVTTKSGRRVTLVRPEVARDSLVAGIFSGEVARTEPVALAGVSPSAITVLKADEAGYRQIRVATGDGQVVLVDDPVFRGDSVIGTRPLSPQRTRTGVPLSDIKAIQVHAANAPLTALGAVAGAAVVATTVLGIVAVNSLNY
jgi:hypothetical protein